MGETLDGPAPGSFGNPRQGVPFIRDLFGPGYGPTVEHLINMLARQMGSPYGLPIGQRYNMAAQAYQLADMQRRSQVMDLRYLDTSRLQANVESVFGPKAGRAVGEVWDNPFINALVRPTPAGEWAMMGIGSTETMALSIYEAEKRRGPLGRIPTADEAKNIATTISADWFAGGRNRSPFPTLDQGKIGQLYGEMVGRGMVPAPDTRENATAKAEAELGDSWKKLTDTGKTAVVDRFQALNATDQLKKISGLFTTLADILGPDASVAQIVRSMELMTGGMAGGMTEPQLKATSARLRQYSNMIGVSGPEIEQAMMQGVQYSAARGVTNQQLGANIGLDAMAATAEYLRGGKAYTEGNGYGAERAMSFNMERLTSAAKSSYAAEVALAGYAVEQRLATPEVKKFYEDAQSGEGPQLKEAYQLSRSGKINRYLGDSLTALTVQQMLGNADFMGAAIQRHNAMPAAAAVQPIEIAMSVARTGGARGDAAGDAYKAVMKGWTSRNAVKYGNADFDALTQIDKMRVAEDVALDVVKKRERDMLNPFKADENSVRLAKEYDITREQARLLIVSTAASAGTAAGGESSRAMRAAAMEYGKYIGGEFKLQRDVQARADIDTAFQQLGGGNRSAIDRIMEFLRDPSNASMQKGLRRALVDGPFAGKSEKAQQELLTQWGREQIAWSYANRPGEVGETFRKEMSTLLEGFGVKDFGKQSSDIVDLPNDTPAMTSEKSKKRNDLLASAKSRQEKTDAERRVESGLAAAEIEPLKKAYENYAEAMGSRDPDKIRKANEEIKTLTTSLGGSENIAMRIYEAVGRKEGATKGETVASVEQFREAQARFDTQSAILANPNITPDQRAEAEKILVSAKATLREKLATASTILVPQGTAQAQSQDSYATMKAGVDEARKLEKEGKIAPEGTGPTDLVVASVSLKTSLDKLADSIDSNTRALGGTPPAKPSAAPASTSPVDKSSDVSDEEMSLIDDPDRDSLELTKDAPVAMRDAVPSTDAAKGSHAGAGTISDLGKLQVTLTPNSSGGFTGKFSFV